MLTATFRDLDSAERAYQYLIDRGYSKDDISVLMSDGTRANSLPSGVVVETETGNKAAAGGVTGAALGGTAGAIAAALAGLGVGGAAGGLIGALVGAGIPEEHAKIYEKDIREGNIVLVVMPRNELDAQIIERDWSGYALNIHH
jgi:uncharacterized membrane protein